MTRITAMILSFSTTLAASAAEQAEKGTVLGDPKQSIVPAVVGLVTFGIAFGVLSTLVWPKIVRALKDRENKIKEEIEAAEMAREQAKDALEEYQRSLAQARAEAQRMIDQARAQQAAVAAELKATADAELSAMREVATRDIENAKRAAVSDLDATSANLAAHLAGKILKRNITADDHQRLIAESLGQLETMKN